jgi:hypothetical protein
VLLLQHAIELPCNDFHVKYRVVWPDSLTEAVEQNAGIHFVETAARSLKNQRRCRALKLRQLLLDRRELVSTQRKLSPARFVISPMLFF